MLTICKNHFLQSAELCLICSYMDEYKYNLFDKEMRN